MPRTCTICNHLDRRAVELALLAGEPFRHIAARTGTSTGALQRHKDHLPKELAKTHEAQDLAQAGTLMAGVRTAHERSERLYGCAEQILMRALENGDSRTALQSIRAAVDVMGEARGYLQLQGEITGELERQQAVVMMVSAGPVAQMTATQAGRVEAEAAIIDIEPGSM